MALMRVRIANTEAIAKYRITPSGVDIVRIVGLNGGKWGRRPIGLDPDGRKALAESIAKEITNVGQTRKDA